MGALFDVSVLERAFSVLISRTVICLLFDTVTAPMTAIGNIAAAVMAKRNPGIGAVTMRSPRTMKLNESANKMVNTTGSIDFNELSRYRSCDVSALLIIRTIGNHPKLQKNS